MTKCPDVASMTSNSPRKDDPAWLVDLNPEQQRAVTHGDGPLLVVAGAGSGKTRTLAYRVAWLMSRGVDPGRILLLTFTRRAADEMLRRAEEIVSRGGGNTTARVWGGTFHATANRLLRVYAKAAGLDPDFTVMDQSDAEDLMNVIRHDLALHSREKRFPRKRTCLAVYSRCVNGGEPLPFVLKQYFPWCEEWEKELKQLFKSYVDVKQDRNVLDYDDLLLYWAQLVADGELADRIGGRFEHVLVDEYQDTNRVQADILKGMRRKVHNIMAVGDDAQSIYGFRAATVRNILDFPEMFPGCTVITLEQNYRSTTPILNTTNALIAQASERYTKNLWSSRKGGQTPQLVTCRDEQQQNSFVIETVLKHYEGGIPLRKQAVLFRAGHLSDTLEVELTRRNIPYHKYGGLRFLEAAHVKDLISILRVAENPRDEIAWFRALQLLDGVGPATAARAVQHVVSNGNRPDALLSFPAPPAAAGGFHKLGELMKELVLLGNTQPAVQVEHVRGFYAPLIPKLYDNPVPRAHDLESLEQIASGYRSRRRFLTDLQLDPPSSTGDLAGPPAKDEDWLVLSTIHSAKGCEWDTVFLIHAADGFLPSDMATGNDQEIEEELRLTYVATTRARDFLYVTWPLRYYHKWRALGDAHSYAQLCRFFSKEVKASMQAAHLDQGEEEDLADDLSPTRDIRAGIRAMWE